MEPPFEFKIPTSQITELAIKYVSMGYRDKFNYYRSFINELIRINSGTNDIPPCIESLPHNKQKPLIKKLPMVPKFASIENKRYVQSIALDVWVLPNY